MSRLAERRKFLGQLTASSLAGVATCFAAEPAHAIEPIARNGQSKFKFSLAAYSYRDLLTGKTPQLSLEDFIADCARMNLEGTELTSYYFPSEPSEEYLRKLKQVSFRLGLDISGTAVGNDFCHPPGPERDRQLANVKRWVDRADLMGAPVIRIFSGQPHDTNEVEARKLAVEGMQAACDYAGQHGVFLALENHHGLTTRAEDMLAMVRDVKSPWFGVNLDTGNFHSDDIYGDLARLAPYAINVQVKVSISGPDGKRQRSDFKRLAQILSTAGYRGYIVLELEEPEDPREACPRYVNELRAAFAAVS